MKNCELGLRERETFWVVEIWAWWENCWDGTTSSSCWEGRNCCKTTAFRILIFKKIWRQINLNNLGNYLCVVDVFFGYIKFLLIVIPLLFPFWLRWCNFQVLNVNPKIRKLFNPKINKRKFCGFFFFLLTWNCIISI